MSTGKIMKAIAAHVRDAAKNLDKEEVECLITEILDADKIFLYGAGRSGLVARAFAMRLSQLGLTVYFVGETITPGMNLRDLFIVVSGSGETEAVVAAAKVAKKVGAKIAAVTSYPRSSLGKTASCVVKIKGKTKRDFERDHLEHQILGVHSSLTPLGTVFEDVALIFLDGLTGELMLRLKREEAHMRDLHASI